MWRWSALKLLLWSNSIDLSQHVLLYQNIVHPQRAFPFFPHSVAGWCHKSSLVCLEEKLLHRECQRESSTPPMHDSKKSVHALHWMFYLNKSLSITVPNLNSPREKNQRHCGCPASKCCNFTVNYMLGYLAVEELARNFQTVWKKAPLLSPVSNEAHYKPIFYLFAFYEHMEVEYVCYSLIIYSSIHPSNHWFIHTFFTFVGICVTNKYDPSFCVLHSNG